MHHRVSKEASNAFFEIGKKWFHLLIEAKEKEGKAGDILQFVHLRRLLHKKHVPRIDMEVGYVHKISGEETVVENVEHMPVSKFPPNEYLKKYEIASVKVIFFEKFCSFSFFKKFCFRHHS